MRLRVKRATGETAANGSPVEMIAPLFEPLRWPVYRVHIADPAPEWLQKLFTQPEPGPVVLPVGVCHWSDFLDPRIAQSLVVRPIRVYSPFSESDALASAALRVNPDVPRAIVAFLNKWGGLGVGAGGGTRLAGVESLTLVQDMFRKFQTMVRLYKHLADDRPVSALKEDSLEGVLLLPWLESRAEQDNAKIWAAFSRALYPFLRGASLGVQWDTRAGRFPVFHVTNLYEVLFLTLWGWATEGTKLRWCHRSGCGSLFVIQRSDQVYCNHGCASHAAVIRSRQKAKAGKTRGPTRSRHAAPRSKPSRAS